MNCRELVERVTDYFEGALAPADRARTEQHLAACEGCRVYADEMRALGAVLRQPVEPVAAPTKEKLLGLFRDFHQARAGRGERNVPLGIENQYAATGDHIGYFWESAQQFEEAVGFLEVGLRGRDFCVVFGYEEANQKVLDLLRRQGFDPERLIAGGRLLVAGGGPSGASLLANLGAVFQAAVAGGAPLIRLLGNIGWGRPNWPEENDILEFEARVTQAARSFPCVVVCLYDVQALPGRIIFKGGFETHPLAVREHVLQENAFYVPLEPYLSRLHSAAGSRRIQ